MKASSGEFRRADEKLMDEFFDRLDKELKTLWKHISELHWKVAELQTQMIILREFIKQR